jgi:hypothetical protein
MREEIENVIEILQSEKKELEQLANGDWNMLAQTVGMQRAIDLLEELLQ